MAKNMQPGQGKKETKCSCLSTIEEQGQQAKQSTDLDLSLLQMMQCSKVSLPGEREGKGLFFFVTLFLKSSRTAGIHQRVDNGAD